MQKNTKNKAIRIAEFKAIMANAVSRNITDQLDKMGFFTAPASTKYHGAYSGGLFDHSKIVAQQLVDLTDKLGLKWQNPSSPYVVGMFHDLCKCDTYKYVSNGDKSGGHFEYVRDTVLDGHGDKSVIIAQKLLHGTLTDEEIACIRWHMGAFDDKERWNNYRYAITQFPNVLYTHTADMIASTIFDT